MYLPGTTRRSNIFAITDATAGHREAFSLQGDGTSHDGRARCCTRSALQLLCAAGSCWLRIHQDMPKRRRSPLPRPWPIRHWHNHQPRQSQLDAMHLSSFLTHGTRLSVAVAHLQLENRYTEGVCNAQPGRIKLKTSIGFWQYVGGRRTRACGATTLKKTAPLANSVLHHRRMPCDGTSASRLPKFRYLRKAFAHQLQNGPRLCGSGRFGTSQGHGSWMLPPSEYGTMCSSASSTSLSRAPQ